MISRITGTLEAREIDRVEVMTAGGTGYLMQIPLSVYEILPKIGEPVALFTSLIVKEDGWLLFGFASQLERRVFDLVRTANGVGPALALSLLSSLTASRLVRAIVEKDTVTSQSVPRVGKKKAEQMILDLATKMREVGSPVSRSRGRGRYPCTCFIGIFTSRCRTCGPSHTGCGHRQTHRDRTYSPGTSANRSTLDNLIRF